MLADPLVGTFAGRYRIERLIARGGMGHVYAAVQPEIGSRTAIKILDEKATENPELVERFFAEARAINLIAHENIVKVLDLAWLDDGRPYIVMEYVDGVTLAQAVRGGRAPLGGVVRVLSDVLSALAAAHERGIVHRDLKPDNILITSKGHAKVVDFGIAKLAAQHAVGVRTATGALLGTPAYMGPEQISGARDVDARTDIYAAGAVLFHACTGRPPFDGATIFDVMRAHLEEAPPSPRRLRHDVPASLEHVILTALQKDPARRFQSASAMSAALEAVDDIPDAQWIDLSPRSAPMRASGPRLHVQRDTPPAMSVAIPVARSRRWIYGVVAAIVLAALAVAFVMTRSSARFDGALAPKATAIVAPAPADAMPDATIDATAIVVAAPDAPRARVVKTATPPDAMPDAAPDAAMFVVTTKVEIPRGPDDELTADQLQVKYRVAHAARPKHDVPTPDVPYVKYIEGAQHDFDVVKYIDRAAEHVATIPTPTPGKPALLEVRVVFTQPDGTVDLVTTRVEYRFRLASATAVGCVAVVTVTDARTFIWVVPKTTCTGSAIAAPKCNPSRVYATQLADIPKDNDGIDRRPTHYTFDGKFWIVSPGRFSRASDSCF